MSHYVLTQPVIQSTLLTHVPVASTLPHGARKEKKDGEEERVAAWLVGFSERNKTLPYISNGEQNLGLCCVLGGRGKASSCECGHCCPSGYQAAGRCLLAKCLQFLHLAGPESLTLLHKAPAMRLSELYHQLTLWDSCLYMATLNLLIPDISHLHAEGK